MRPSMIIPRLRAQCPIFSNRVAGAIAFRQAMGADDFSVPHAFVLLMGVVPTGQDVISQLDQVVNAQLQVVIAVSSAADDRGQDAAEQMLTCFVQVRDALLGWSPDVLKFGPIIMDGLVLSEGESFTRARSWAECNIVSEMMVRDLV